MDNDEPKLKKSQTGAAKSLMLRSSAHRRHGRGEGRPIGRLDRATRDRSTDHAALVDVCVLVRGVMDVFAGFLATRSF